MREKVHWDSFRIEEGGGYIIVEGSIHSHWDKDGKWKYNCGGKCVEKAKEYIEKSNLIKNNLKSMNTIKTTIKNLLRTEPEKAFVKAGFLDEQENVTTKGQEALMYVLWEQNKTALKELADKINAENNK